MADIKLTPEVRDVLERSTITATTLKLPQQLPRPLYEAVNKIIKLAGGKWKKGPQCHQFDHDPREMLGLTLQTGKAVDKKKKLQFFPTPKSLADTVAFRAGVLGMRVLEPSAGHGALVLACLKEDAHHVDAVELDPQNAQILRTAVGRGPVTVQEADFLTLNPADYEPYDCVVMNPPFTKGQDLKHLAHAYKFLAPGGRLIAILLPHTAEQLEAVMPDDRCCWATEELEAGTFKESGTNIVTMLLVLDKYERPAAAPAPEPEALPLPVPPLDLSLIDLPLFCR